MKTLGNKKMNKMGWITLVIVLFSMTSAMAQKSVKNIFRPEKTVVVAVEKAEPRSDVAIGMYDVYTKSLDFVIEEKLEIEDWMTNPDSWAVSKKEAKTPCTTEQEVVKEDEVNLEAWMFNFEITDSKTIISEQELALEDWMVTSEQWNL